MEAGGEQEEGQPQPSMPNTNKGSGFGCDCVRLTKEDSRESQPGCAVWGRGGA